MKKRTSLFYTVHQLKPHTRSRGKVLKRFSDRLGFAYLGAMHQHDDEYDAIRGFTASTSHRDSHYTVGTYEDTNIRIVNRFDIQKRHGKAANQQAWVVMEFQLKTTEIPHVFFVPTGKTAGSYARVFTANIHMQPLNSILQGINHSPEFYGRYQILSRPTHSHRIESLLTSPVIFSIGEKLWPHGVEIDGNKLYVYISEEDLTSETLDTAFIAGLWLTDELNLLQIDS